MRIGNVLNDFTMPGGEPVMARAIAERLGAVRFERSSTEWAALRGLDRIGPVFRSFANAPVAREFREWALREKPDVVLFHNIFPVLSPSIVQEAANLGIRVVLYLHSYRYLCTNGFFLNHGKLCERCIHGNFWPAAATACWRDSHALSAWYGAILFTLRPRGFFEAVDRFIAISDFVRSKYAEAGLPAEKITTLHHFFDASRVQPSGRDDGYVFFIGRLSEEKGVMTLLETARKLPDVPFRIAGDGPLFDPAWKFIADHGLKNVSMEGFVDGERKRELFAGARFVVVPSEWNEPFGMVVLEAYAAGKPVLASRMGGLGEIVDAGQTGDFFISRHPQSLAEGVRRMFDDPARTRAWGQNARRWVETRADPAQWERSMRQILEEVVQC